VPDLFTFDLADGLASGECPICFALRRHTRRWLDSFCRQGRQDPATRKRFYAAGGFCRAHAWLFHELAGDSGAAIADVYGRLAEQDLSRLDELLGGRRSRRPSPAAALRRRAPCPLCAEEIEALPRKAEFFLELVATEAGRARYERSRGLCYEHLVSVLDTAGDRDALAAHVLDDWRRRLEGLRRRLAEYDRKRDHRHAAERRDAERRSPAEMIRHYVGPAPVVGPGD
jgi:hypothetical protein